MKKLFYIVLFLVASIGFAQSKAITYQAVIYLPGGQNAPGVNMSNVPMANRAICLQFSFVNATDQLEYQEEVKVRTDEFGMVNIVIGQGVQSGGYASSFDAIVWNAVSQKSLQVALDVTGLCNQFEALSNQPIASVPFANAAITAGNVTGIVALVNGGTGATNATAAKVNLGIGNVENTADLTKPMSTATKTYIDSQLSSSAIVDADATTKGKIQLAGDLSGTAAAPTVPGLANKENVTNKSTNIVADAASTSKYPSVKVIKDYVDALNAAAGVADGSITSAKIANATIINADVSPTAAIDFIKLNIQKSDILGLGIVKTDLGLANVDNTSDANKPVSTATQAAINLKVDKVSGERLINATEITKLSNQSGTNTGDQDLSALATTSAVNSTLNLKVDKVSGERLLNATEITKLSNQSGTNTGDQDLSALATTLAVTSSLNLKVDKVLGERLINATEITKLSKQSGINTGDQDLSALATTLAVTSSLNLKVDKVLGERLINAIEITKLSNQSGTNTGDQDLSSFATNTALALKANLASPTFTGTVSGIDKTMVGLTDVDNTSDASKPVSTLTQTALDLKVDKVTGERLINAIEITKLSNQTGTNTGDQNLSALATTAATTTALALKANLASPTFTGTVSGIDKTMVGLSNVDNTADANKPVSTDAQNALNLKANLASPTFTGTVSGIDKTMVGLSNADNTTDANKPVSTDAQNALNLKANLLSPTFTGTPTLPSGTIGVTQAIGNNSTALATTAFVTSAVAAGGAFVDLVTSQTIAGVKTFSSDAVVNGLTIGRGAGTNTAYNTAVGSGALRVNAGGYYNTAFGREALYNNTSGFENTAIGLSALYGNSTGTRNTATGFAALYSNSNGMRNTANGVYALYGNQTGNDNTANGHYALQSNRGGNYNTANGSNALFYNFNGSNNTAIGFETLYENTNANGNTGTGYQALRQNVGGNSNTATGNTALYDNNSGSNNTAFGSNTGRGIVSGSGNTVLGANVTGLAAALTNNIILANGTGAIQAQNDGTNWTMQGKVNATEFVGALTGNAATVTTNANLTGAVTSAGNATTIATNAVTTAKVLDGNVTYAKIQNVSATDKVLGRVSAGSGVVEEISTTGTGNVVRATSPALVTPILGVATAISVNGTAIPTNKTLVVTTDKLNSLASTTSTELAGVIFDETGTGTLVLSVSPALTGTPTAPTALATDSSTQIATTAFVIAASITEVADEFISTAAQTSFTLTQTPTAKSRVKMYVNGIRISNSAYSSTGTTLTYVPVNNGNYALSVGDRIQFDYSY